MSLPPPATTKSGDVEQSLRLQNKKCFLKRGKIDDFIYNVISFYLLRWSNLFSEIKSRDRYFFYYFIIIIWNTYSEQSKKGALHCTFFKIYTYNVYVYCISVSVHVITYRDFIIDKQLPRLIMKWCSKCLSYPTMQLK